VVNRAAYGGERIVLVSRGKPKAALVSIKDLELLESLVSERALRRARRREALAEADALREAILSRRGDVPLPDSVEDLRNLREERIRDSGWDFMMRPKRGRLDGAFDRGLRPSSAEGSPKSVV
jgi:prevent-host-death family protein